MQENFEFAQSNHHQGRLPLVMEQTAPNLRQNKRSCVFATQYAYSIKTSRVKEPDFPYEGQRISCTAELLHFAHSLQDSDIEKMLTLYMDPQNAIICIQVNSGTVNQACVYPREIIRHALLVGSSSIILIHNHPSGCMKPSESDILLTRKIREVAEILDIIVHDHVIIGAKYKYFSFREEGLLSCPS